MKKIEILNLNEILSKVKLNKLEKDVRDVVLTNHLLVFKLADEIKSHIEEIKKKYYEGLDSEISILQKYRSEYSSNSTSDSDKNAILEKATKECGNILVAEQNVASFVEKFLLEDVDVPINKISQSVFVEICAASDIDITPADMIKYEFLF